MPFSYRKLYRREDTGRNVRQREDSRTSRRNRLKNKSVEYFLLSMIYNYVNDCFKNKFLTRSISSVWSREFGSRLSVKEPTLFEEGGKTRMPESMKFQIN